MNEIYSEGWEAGYYDNDTYHDYKDGSEQAQEWLRGFYDGQEDKHCTSEKRVNWLNREPW